MKIELDSQRHTMTLDGVTIDLGVLRTMVKPNPNIFYQFIRNGNEVMVTSIQVKA